VDRESEEGGRSGACALSCGCFEERYGHYRPRASTSPWLPSLFGDHQSWFNDPRFDGSFPSRVLPFLYLGNLNHASNAYMLHALGITHVVSVGECALVPPPHHEGDTCASGSCPRPVRSGPHFVAGKGPGGQGSLWIEEREGRIKVLDIQGVCDDGIDTLEPQLEPICEWIEKARKEGGQVLVHCRVGVSRSATVTIAYVMKHLGLPLVDAYLIVRSRRLSVLIQPNMRLLYNLCGWEVTLARERAGDDEEQLKYELARTLSWPYLAREVHSLNEKYLH
jgi:dual specificity MAP kinase phosphatase